MKLVYQAISFMVQSNQDDLTNLLSNCSTEFTWMASFSVNYMHELGLKLFLEAMSCGDYCEDEEMAYEFAVQVFINVIF